MKVKICGSIELQPSVIEKALEGRLAKYGLTLGKLEDPQEKECKGIYFGGSAPDETYLLERKTSDYGPRMIYSLKLDECFTIDSFVRKLNNKKNHTEQITIELGRRESFIAFFYGGQFAFFYMDDTKRFAVSFINEAFQHYFDTDISLEGFLLASDGHNIIKKYILNEKRARSPPSTPSFEFQPNALNRDLVYLIVDEFTRRVQK